MSKDIRDDPRYRNMTLPVALLILRKFEHDYGSLTSAEMREAEKTEDGAVAVRLYALALGWLIETGHWPGYVDPEFVALVKWR